MIRPASFAESYALLNRKAFAALLITQKPDESFNSMTMEWYMRTSIQPPMFAISVGHTRYSYECLRDKRYFNLVIPSKQMEELTHISGRHSGREIDKLSMVKLEHFSGKLQRFPVFKDALACFECEVISQIRSGDHTIFIGQVKHSWVSADSL